MKFVLFSLFSSNLQMNFCFLDTANHRIRKIEYSTGNRSCIVSCLAGLCGKNTLSKSESQFQADPLAGYADGPGETAR